VYDSFPDASVLTLGEPGPCQTSRSRPLSGRKPTYRVKMVVLGRLMAAVAFGAASIAVRAATGDEGAHNAIPSSREVEDMRAQGLRLVKTSDDDPGTWMTEEEKFDKLISKKIGFSDITDTTVSPEDRRAVKKGWRV
jgi:hypothetical protein